MVERISYRGWQNAWRVSNHKSELIVLADVGPRIVSYRLCGSDNIFHEVPEDAGRTGGNDFRLYGGHRLWAWPEVARTYFPDNRQVAVTEAGGTVCFKSPIEDTDPGTHLQKQIEVDLERENSVILKHTITNYGKANTELAVWCPTMMRAGGSAILPLAPRAAMDTEHYQSVAPLTLWSFTDFADPRWRIGTDFIQLRQERKSAGRFREQMSGTFNPLGWGAYYCSGTLFIKWANPVAKARYPDFGCNFEIFTNPEFLELESLSPIVELHPGESVTHMETWALFDHVPPGEDDNWIRSEIAPIAESHRPAQAGKLSN